MTKSKTRKRMTLNQLQAHSLGPLRQLAKRWRVVADELGDPYIPLTGDRGIVYEIDVRTLGLWLKGKPEWWIQNLRKRFAATDVRQRGDVEVVIAWPVADSRTDELLGVIKAWRRRRLSEAQRERLLHWSQEHSPLRHHGPEGLGAPESTQRAITGSDMGQGGNGAE